MTTKSIYATLNREKREIRLLRFDPSQESRDIEGHIRLDLRSYAIDEAPDYAALSYTWGDASTKAEISINGNGFTARENLYQALQRLRVLDQVQPWLWIDAICINQKDDVERGWQVDQMRDIYSRAEIVYIWLGTVALGPAADDVNHTFRQLEIIAQIALDAGVHIDADNNELYNEGHTEQICEQPVEMSELHSESFVRGISSLLHHDYFVRVWVVQEVALSKTGLVLYNTSSLSLDRLSLAFEAMKLAISELEYSIPFPSGLSLESRPLRLRREIRNKSRFEETLFLDLFTLVGPNTAGQTLLLASDPRDVVYGFLGIATDAAELGITADYTLSVIEVYTKVMATILEREIIDLGYCDLPREIEGLPSWVPDWQRLAIHDDESSVIHRYEPHASSGLHCHPDLTLVVIGGLLQVSGCFVDTIIDILARDGWESSYGRLHLLKTAKSWDDNAKNRTKTLFKMKSGWVGLGPNDLSINDEVVVLYKASMPLVVRPQGDGKYSIIGEAYIDTIMFGEIGQDIDSVQVFNIV